MVCGGYFCVFYSEGGVLESLVFALFDFRIDLGWLCRFRRSLI